jgi:hypothetical protein
MEEDLLEDRGHLPSFYGTLKMSAVPIHGNQAGFAYEKRAVRPQLPSGRRRRRYYHQA